MHDLAYRKELDGVRAIAVVSVILFHVGFPSMPGGYVGVDVFFVLSGYLICGQTYLRLRDGTYSATDFFARRIRRLSTAYFACFLVTALVAHMLFLREDLAEIYANLIGSVTFTNNYNLLFSQGYFNQDAHENPFLHTWSLSIEEQFYIVLPILILLTRRSLTAFTRMLVAGFVISLALALLSGQQIYLRDQRFFATSFRVWELALGGLVFVALERGWRLPRGPVLPLIGLALVIAPVGWIDDSWLYPGFITLAPTLGTALLIATASPAEGYVGRALAARPMAYIGRISYGAYLWHWPLIVYATTLWGALNDEFRTGLVLGSLALGAMSYHLIEQPIRRVNVRTHKEWLYAMFAVQTVILLLLAAWLSHQSTKEESFEDLAMQKIKTEIGNFHDRWDDCWNKMGPDEYCRIGAEGEGEVDYIVWGDSMANSALPGFDAYGKATGQRGFMATAAACAPLPDISREYGGAETCIAFNDGVRAYLKDAPPMTVYLMARWTYYAEGYDNQRSNTPNEAVMVDRAGAELPGPNIEIFEPAFAALLDEIGERHEVKVMNLWPVAPYSVPVVMLREAWFGTYVPPITLEAYEARGGRVVALLERLAKERGMQVFAPHETLCATGTCVLHEDGVPLYVDQTHLGQAGNRVLERMLLGQE
ncbi:acyltransferase [Roseovarius faecimaris]|uniref:Acyltransferase n=1 Tax=Roseovarius faecimaris TaxID=2494550 RepID=A0A6I6INA6_9RHOB|nr:acyltransferase family protein [Roseovarius faecimaris]QGX98145.1 acyltransferase [Roseovarius faecimaris]